jgi:hypothetical protein
MPRLTPERDAEIQAEIEAERPKIRAARQKIEGHLAKLSDVGRLQALFDLTVRFYSSLGSEEDAIAGARHLADRIEIALKQVYRPEHDAPPWKQ